MSRIAIGVAVVLLAAVLSSAAFAGRGAGGGHGGGGGGHGGGGHFGGAHIGGGHFGGGHFGGGHFGGHSIGHAHFGGGHVAHFAPHAGSFAPHAGSFAPHGGANFSHVRTAALGAGNVHNAFNSLHGNTLHTARVLSNPSARAHLAAGAAVAGWHGGAANAWWRHNNFGFGWVGPLFWPFAFYDIFDYWIWGYPFGFWDYGYPDIYAGIFGPYAYDELYGYMGGRPYGRRHRSSFASLAEMCGDDRSDIAGLPIDQIQQTIEPTEAQRAALDDLSGASIRAAQTIRAACPTQAALTAPGRLAAMQGRIEAMISAVGLVRSPLEKLYGLLDDEQKARLNALGEDQRKVANNARGPLVQSCGAAQPAAFTWPAGEIDARVHPNDTQRAALEVLQDTSSRAADTLKAACQPADAVTPPGRLEAVATRLDTMLQAVKSVRAALEDFYATLSDEQKAQFEAIGPRRTS